MLNSNINFANLICRRDFCLLTRSGAQRYFPLTTPHRSVFVFNKAVSVSFIKHNFCFNKAVSAARTKVLASDTNAVKIKIWWA